MVDEKRLAEAVGAFKKCETNKQLRVLVDTCQEILDGMYILKKGMEIGAIKNCELCGSPVKVVGEIILRYKRLHGPVSVRLAENVHRALKKEKNDGN